MAMFEIKISNSVNDQTQHVAGKYGTNTGASFVGAECPAGTLCVQNGLIPNAGYEAFGVLNGNTWCFNAAATGAVDGFNGDHTGIYAFNNYDVNKVTGGGLTVNIGVDTLGLSLPAGEFGDFCEIRIGEQYAFDAGNFSTAPGADDTTGYATISAGKLVFSDTAPKTAGLVYFEVLRTANVNKGTQYVGKSYILRAVRNAAA